MKNEKKLYRSETNRVIFGVCGGLGEYFNIDPIIFRIIFLAITLGGGSGVLLYIILAFIMPKASEPEFSDKEEPQLKRKAEGLVSELKELKNTPKNMNFVGIMVVIFGFFLLFSQILPWIIFNSGLLWLVLIIGLGVLVLKSSGQEDKSRAGKEDDSRKKEIKAAEVNEHKKEYTVKEVHHYHESKSGGFVFSLFFGLIFLLIGIGFLARNLGLMPGFNFDFFVLLDLWPVFIILVGLSLLAKETWLGKFLSVLATLAIVFCIMFFFVFSGKLGTAKVSNFEINKAENITKANISVETGASSVDISGGTMQLVSGKLESNVTELTHGDTTENGEQSVDIGTKGGMRNLRGNVINNFDLRLADDIPLYLKINLGASELNLDATDLMIENLLVEVGASDIDLTLGDKADISHVSVNAGASSITMIVPNKVGIKIEVEGALNSKNFPDFKKISENLYQTDNYDTAGKKIEIKINASASSISVLRKLGDPDVNAMIGIIQKSPKDSSIPYQIILDVPVAGLSSLPLIAVDNIIDAEIINNAGKKVSLSGTVEQKEDGSKYFFAEKVSSASE